MARNYPPSRVKKEPNSFELGMVPEKILGKTVQNGKLQYAIKFMGFGKPEFLDMLTVQSWCPKLFKKHCEEHGVDPEDMLWKQEELPYAKY